MPGQRARQNLNELSSLLHGKANGDLSPVIAVVGAGASAGAGLPLGWKLKEELRKPFRRNPDLNRVLNHEVNAVYSDRGLPVELVLDDLSLFEFAALLSRFAFGRDQLDRTLVSSLGKPDRRPLAYELLAHLAKHRFIDHFIVLNFDTLLDGAVSDELPERAKIVASPREVPSADEFDPELSYLVRPFGQLGRKPYSISTEDVSRFGPEPFPTFMHDVLPFRDGADDAPLILLILGYAGAEPGFRSFMRAVGTIPGSGKTRRVIMFVVDVADRMPRSYRDFERQGVVEPVRYIQCHADTALEMLLALLKRRSESEKQPVWISAARHFLVSRCCTYDQLTVLEKRFKTELLLQAVKSRGFVHLEAFSRVPRLLSYADDGAHDVLKGLLRDQIIEKDDWLGSSADIVPPDAEYVPNYMITSNAAVVEELCGSNAGLPVVEWLFDEYSGAGTPRFKRKQRTLSDYVAGKLQEIERAPEIEIVPDAAPEAAWLLGDVRPLRSIYQLTTESRNLLERAIDSAKSGKRVTVQGIWSTGEWLFHDEGWAADVGNDLLDQKNVEIQFVCTAPGGKRGTRSSRRDAVISKCRAPHKAKVTVRQVNWWELNRALTLITIGKDVTAIYLRRRLSTPLVSPYLVESNIGIRYLQQLWCMYLARSHPAAIPFP